MEARIRFQFLIEENLEGRREFKLTRQQWLYVGLIVSISTFLLGILSETTYLIIFLIIRLMNTNLPEKIIRYDFFSDVNIKTARTRLRNKFACATSQKLNHAI